MFVAASKECIARNALRKLRTVTECLPCRERMEKPMRTARPAADQRGRTDWSFGECIGMIPITEETAEYHVEERAIFQCRKLTCYADVCATIISARAATIGPEI